MRGVYSEGLIINTVFIQSEGVYGEEYDKIVCNEWRNGWL